MLSQDYLSQDYLAQDYLGGAESEEAPPEAVPASITITPDGGTGAQGGTLQLTATVLDTNGAEMDVVESWSSSAPSVATVNASGLVSFVAGGSTEITASYLTLDDTVIVNVTAPDAVPDLLPAGDMRYIRVGLRVIRVSGGDGGEASGLTMGDEVVLMGAEDHTWGET